MRDAATTHVIYVQQGSNNYEWHVICDGRKIATLLTSEQAAAFAEGFTLGWRTQRDATA